jgi:hypothetical protein
MARSKPIIPVAALLVTAALAVLGGCASETAADEEAAATTSEAMSTKIYSDYGVTTFGGPGDYQPTACGGNTRDIGPWYVASSQRYGCNKHLKLVAKGKCLVVKTADAGPASFVESHAGVPVLDASPDVANYFFGLRGLGWSDLKSHPGKYAVHATLTTLPLGPCTP